MAVEGATRGLLRIEDLEGKGMPQKLFELIEGELIQMTPPHPRHNRIASNVEFLFRIHCQQHPELDFAGDNDGFVVERNPDTYLVPDASLFRSRPGAEVWHREFGPEIVVEVRSPSNGPSEIAFKRHRFFDAGTEQFWLVDPEAEQIQLFYRNGSLRTVTREEIFVGDGFAAGLQFQVKDLFPPR